MVDKLLNIEDDDESLLGALPLNKNLIINDEIALSLYHYAKKMKDEFSKNPTKGQSDLSYCQNFIEKLKKETEFNFIVGSFRLLRIIAHGCKTYVQSNPGLTNNTYFDGIMDGEIDVYMSTLYSNSEFITGICDKDGKIDMKSLKLGKIVNDSKRKN